ncbi:MAG: SPFH/Band 7/PHB domain protein [Crenarchaeota archaeon]|jgi:regulator of protease activity HflC (stomatin/prohibitin superfamily)|nr:SPFH/Band 7/PHB domain protein [Thermoproteota archaeon]
MVDIIQIIAIVIPLAIIVYALISSLRIVRPTERGLVERLGRYHRFVHSGITLLVPFVDRIIKVNITERMTPVQRQDVITRDKVFMGVDAVVFYKVKTDETAVKASQYFVNNYESQIDTLARTVLRDIIGGMDMTVANTSRPTINAKLKEALDEQTKDWGIEIVRAEIKDLEPPRGLMSSMESVLKADNERQAAEKTAIAQATLASGEKNAAIQRAEGQKQSAILQAEGQKTATIAIAEGDAEATKLRNEALTTYFKDSAITFKQLETISSSLQNNTKIIVPEGKAISLILNEQENLTKGTVLPIPPPPQTRTKSQQ